MKGFLKIFVLIGIISCIFGFVVLLNFFIFKKSKNSQENPTIAGGWPPNIALGGPIDFILDPIEDATGALRDGLEDWTDSLLDFVEEMAKQAYKKTANGIMTIVDSGIEAGGYLTDWGRDQLEPWMEIVKAAFTNAMALTVNQAVPLVIGMISGFTWDMFLPQGSKEEKCNRVNQICNNYDEIKSGSIVDIKKCEDAADQIKSKQGLLCSAANADPLGIADPLGFGPMLWSAAWDPVRKSEASMLIAGLLDTMFNAAGAENIHVKIGDQLHGDPDGILSVASYGNWLRSTENIETDKEKYIDELVELCSRPVSVQFKNLILCRVIMHLGIHIAPDVIKDKNVVLDKETIKSLPGYAIKAIADEFERFYGSDFTENFTTFGKIDDNQVEYCSSIWKMYTKKGKSVNEISSELNITDTDVKNQIATYIKYKKEFKQLSENTSVLNDATFVAQNIYKNRFNLIHNQWKDYIYMFILDKNTDIEKQYLNSTPVGKLRMLNELRSIEEARLLDEHPFIKKLVENVDENKKIYITYKMMLTDWTRKYIEELLIITADIELRKANPKSNPTVPEDEINDNNFLETSVWSNNMWNMAHVDEITVNPSNIPDVFCNNEEIPEIPGQHLKKNNIKSFKKQQTAVENINQDIKQFRQQYCDYVELLIWNNIDKLHYFEIALLSLLKVRYIPVEKENFRIRENFDSVEQMIDIIQEITDYVNSIEEGSTKKKQRGENGIINMCENVKEMTIMLNSAIDADIASSVFELTDKRNADEVLGGVIDNGILIPELQALNINLNNANGPQLGEILSGTSNYSYRLPNGETVAEVEIIERMGELGSNGGPGPGHIPASQAFELYNIEGDLFPAHFFSKVRLPKPVLKFESVQTNEILGIDLDYLPLEIKSTIVYNFVHQNPEYRTHLKYFYPDLPFLQQGQVIPNSNSLINILINVEFEEGKIVNDELIKMYYSDIGDRLKYSDDIFEVFQNYSKDYDKDIFKKLKKRREIASKSFMEDTVDYFFEQYLRKFHMDGVDGVERTINEIREDFLRNNPEFIRRFYTKYYDNMRRFNFQERYALEVLNSDSWEPTGYLKNNYNNGIGSDSFLDRFRDVLNTDGSQTLPRMDAPMHDFLSIESNMEDHTERLAVGDFSRFVDAMNEGMEGMNQYIRGSLYVGGSGISRASYSLNNYINQIYGGMFSGEFTSSVNEIFAYDVPDLDHLAAIFSGNEQQVSDELKRVLVDILPERNTLGEKIFDRNVNVFVDCYLHHLNGRKINDLLSDDFDIQDFKYFIEEELDTMTSTMFRGLLTDDLKQFYPFAPDVTRDLFEHLLPTNDWKDNFYTGKKLDLNSFIDEFDENHLNNYIQERAVKVKCFFNLSNATENTTVVHVPYEQVKAGAKYDVALDMNVPDLSKHNYISLNEFLNKNKTELNKELMRFRQYLVMDFNPDVNVDETKRYVFVNIDDIDPVIPENIYEQARLNSNEGKYTFLDYDDYNRLYADGIILDPETSTKVIEKQKMDDRNAFTRGIVNSDSTIFKWGVKEPKIGPPPNFINLVKKTSGFPAWTEGTAGIPMGPREDIPRVLAPRDSMGRAPLDEAGFNLDSANRCYGMYSFNSDQVCFSSSVPDTKNSIRVAGDLRSYNSHYGEIYFSQDFQMKIMNKLRGQYSRSIQLREQNNPEWRMYGTRVFDILEYYSEIEISSMGVDAPTGPMRLLALRDLTLGKFINLMSMQFSKFNLKYSQKYTDPDFSGKMNVKLNRNRISWGQRIPAGVLPPEAAASIDLDLDNMFDNDIPIAGVPTDKSTVAMVDYKSKFPFEIDNNEWLTNGIRSKHLIETRIKNLQGRPIEWVENGVVRTSVHPPGEYDINLKGLYKTGRGSSFQTFTSEGLSERVYSINPFGQHSMFDDTIEFLWWYQNPADGALSLGFLGTTPQRHRAPIVTEYYVHNPWQNNFKIISSYGNSKTITTDQITSSNKGKMNGIVNMSDFWNYLQNNKRGYLFNPVVENNFNTGWSKLDSFITAQVYPDPNKITTFEMQGEMEDIYNQNFTRSTKPDTQFERKFITSQEITNLNSSKILFYNEFQQYFNIVNKSYSDNVFNIMYQDLSQITSLGVSQDVLNSLKIKKNPYDIYNVRNLDDRIRRGLSSSANLDCNRVFENFIFSSKKTFQAPLCAIQGKYNFDTPTIEEISGAPSNKTKTTELLKRRSLKNIFKCSSWANPIEIEYISNNQVKIATLDKVLNEFFIEPVQNKWIRSAGYSIPRDLRLIKNLMWFPEYKKLGDLIWKPPGYTIQASKKLVSVIRTAAISTTKVVSKFLLTSIQWLGILIVPTIGLGIMFIGEILDAVLCHTKYAEEMRIIAYDSCVVSLANRGKWTSDDCVKDYAQALGCNGVPMETTHGISYRKVGNQCFNNQQNILSDHSTPYQLRTMFNHEIEKGTWDTLNAPLRFPEDIEKWLPPDPSDNNNPIWAPPSQTTLSNRGILVPSSDRDKGRLVGLLPPDLGRRSDGIPLSAFQYSRDLNPEHPSLYYHGSGTWSLGADIGDPKSGFFTENNPDHTDWLKENNIASEICRNIPNYLKQTGVIDEDKIDISDFNYTTGMLDDSPFECTITSYKQLHPLPELTQIFPDTMVPYPKQASCAKKIKCLKCDETSIFDSLKYVKEQGYITKGFNDYGSWPENKNALEFVSELWNTEQIFNLDEYAFLPVYSYNTERPNEIWSSKENFERLSYGYQDPEAVGDYTNTDYKQVGSWLTILQGSNMNNNSNNGFLIPPNAFIQYIKPEGSGLTNAGYIMYNNTKKYLHVKVPSKETITSIIKMNSNKFSSFLYNDRRLALYSEDSWGKGQRVRRLDVIDINRTYKGEVPGFPQLPGTGTSDNRDQLLQFFKTLYAPYVSFGITSFKDQPVYHNILNSEINKKFSSRTEFADIKTRPRPYAQLRNRRELFDMNLMATNDDMFGLGYEMISYPEVLKDDSKLPHNVDDIRFYVPPRTKIIQYNGNKIKKTRHNESFTEWRWYTVADCECVEHIKWKYE